MLPQLLLTLKSNSVSDTAELCEVHVYIDSCVQCINSQMCERPSYLSLPENKFLGWWEWDKAGWEGV